MWKSIIYKEWLKTRWALLILSIIGILVLVYTFLQVRHGILFLQATDYWYSILFKGANYFSLFKYLPFLAGFGIAVAQYFPETVDKRIKLTFHLPENENKILIQMHLFGFLSILILFLVFIGSFVAGSAIFFPSDIITLTLITAIPWFLGGLATYSMVALVLLEPVWRYKILYALISYGFVSQFYLGAGLGEYAPSILSLTVLMLASSIVVLFSGYRFRKGEM